MRLRVLTYNIHKCVGGLDRRCDPRRVADVIAAGEPDVVLLQEAASRTVRGVHEDQAELLGRFLSLRHRTFVPHLARRGGDRYGNAVLSRFPILESGYIDLTIPFKKKRGALHVRLRARASSGRVRTLHIYNLHLGLSGIERKMQLRRFLKSHPFARLHARAPIVVGGDFNDVWGTLGRKILVPAGFRGMPQRLSTFPAIAPVRMLDALYVRGDVKIVHAQRGRTGAARLASDHRPIAAELRLT